MKKFTLVTMIALSLITITKTSLFTYSGGALPQKAGAPGESICTECHGGNATPSTSEVIVNVFKGLSEQATSYQSGQNYTITISANVPGINKFGFEITCFAGSQHAGTFSIFDAQTTAFCSGTSDYVTHTSTGTAGVSNTMIWTVNWKAPSANVGTVTFYVAVNAANGDGTPGGGDKIFTHKVALPFSGTSVSEPLTQNKFIKIYPNPSSEIIQVSTPANFGSGIIHIFDINGKLVTQKELSNNPINSINIQNLPSGFYLVELKNAQYKGVNSFIKR